MSERVWGYIGTTKIIEVNPERKEEALIRGFKIILDANLKALNQQISKAKEVK